ncbi:MAG: 4a-hydroxytetrahydrobiopterin dehydratase [Candidatus Pacebacteria bacterium]|nr:4a-hydroxytetrahydrobiopterin dehydratase [Candidatus Paceibacterota bacterium]
MSLLNKKCVPCEDKNIQPYSIEESTELLQEIPTWRLSYDGRKINKEYHFRDFVESMHFVKKVATIAENEGHHPNIFISYNNVSLEMYTHAIDGLSENDFIVAAKIDAMWQ